MNNMFLLMFAFPIVPTATIVKRFILDIMVILQECKFLSVHPKLHSLQRV